MFWVAARKASFAATAIELGTSPAYVSKRIAILEKDLGVVLFHRNARRVTVTADGENVYRSAQEIFEGVERMGEAVASGRLEPTGVLRVTSSFRLGTQHVAPALSELALRYPKLDITLDVVDRRVDLIAENVDLDVRVGDVDEPHLVSHRIIRSSRILCASPAYVARRGVPASLAALSQHDCLVLRDRHQAFGVWRLVGPGGAEKVKVTGRHQTPRTSFAAGRSMGMASTLDARDVAESIADGTARTRAAGVRGARRRMGCDDVALESVGEGARLRRVPAGTTDARSSTARLAAPQTSKTVAARVRRVEADRYVLEPVSASCAFAQASQTTAVQHSTRRPRA